MMGVPWGKQPRCPRNEAEFRDRLAAAGLRRVRILAASSPVGEVES